MLPANHYGIGGSIALFDNPVMPVSDEDLHLFLSDIHRIRERLQDKGHDSAYQETSTAVRSIWKIGPITF